MQQLLDNQNHMVQLMSKIMANNSINTGKPLSHYGNMDFNGDAMTGPRACKSCGEIGHLSKECTDEWPHCDTNYPDEGCPMIQVSCFLCEGTNHIPTQCHLYLMVQKANEQVKKGIHQAFKEEKDLRHITCYTCKNQGHYSHSCPEKRDGDEVKPESYQNGLTTPAKMEDEARLRTHPHTSKVTTKCCYSCEEEGHFL